MKNMEENSEMILKIWKKGKSNNEKIWKIWKNTKLNSVRIQNNTKKGKLNSEKIWKLWKESKLNSENIFTIQLTFLRIILYPYTIQTQSYLNYRRKVN